ncbi:MAG: hypothetical protein HRU20_28745 [Pseudomonadales bacterium]|nr:hypothetical protein [Pseudomonadales bacterium]
MTLNRVLLDLLARLEVSEGLAVFDWDAVQAWQSGILEALIKAQLLTPTNSARTIECQGCEHHCFMEVITHTYPNNITRAFIVCDVADSQAQMGRIELPLERLQQWQGSTRQLAKVIVSLLGLEAEPDYQQNTASFKLGMLKGKVGRRWVSLHIQPLMLEVSTHSVPVNDVLYFENNTLLIDDLRIAEVLNLPAMGNGNGYTPDVSKREIRKLATQAMYQDWNDEYLGLVKKYPDKADTWYSMQIAKLSIAQGKQSETIRKNMK